MVSYGLIYETRNPDWFFLLVMKMVKAEYAAAREATLDLKPKKPTSALSEMSDLNIDKAIYTANNGRYLVVIDDPEKPIVYIECHDIEDRPYWKSVKLESFINAAVWFDGLQLVETTSEPLTPASSGCGGSV